MSLVKRELETEKDGGDMKRARCDTSFKSCGRLHTISDCENGDIGTHHSVISWLRHVGVLHCKTVLDLVDVEILSIAIASRHVCQLLRPYVCLQSG